MVQRRRKSRIDPPVAPDQQRWWTVDDQINFALEIAQTDPAQTPRPNWPDRLRQFFETASPIGILARQELSGPLDSQAWLDLQRDLRALFGAVIQRTQIVPLPVAFRIDFLPAFQSAGVCLYTGPTRDVFLALLLALIVHVDPTRLQGCAVCGAWFLRVKRQTVCTRRECQQKRRQRNWQRFINSTKGVEKRIKDYERFSWTPGARAHPKDPAISKIKAERERRAKRRQRVDRRTRKKVR